MKRSFCRVLCLGMTTVSLFNLTGCTLVDRLKGAKETDYGLMGKPVDDASSLFILNGDFVKEGYSINSPVCLISDNDIVIDYTSDGGNLLVDYDFVSGKTVNEVKIDAGTEITFCADNGSLLLRKADGEASEYFVYDKNLKKVFSSKENKIETTEMTMSLDGSTLGFSDKEGKSVSIFDLKEGKATKVRELADEGLNEGDAQMYISKISSDASKIIINTNVFKPEFSAKSCVYDTKEKKAEDVDFAGDSVEACTGKFLVYNANSNDGLVKVYDNAKLGTDEYTKINLENAEEITTFDICNDTTAISEVVIKADADYNDCVCAKSYNLENGMADKSVMASADSIFEAIKSEKNYESDNAANWFNSVKTGDRTSVRMNSEGTMAAITIEDNYGVRVLIWKLA